MPATKVNLSQMVDLAVGTSEVGAVNCNVLHTLLHAMLSRVQTNEKGIAKVWFILDSFPHIYRLIGLSFICFFLLCDVMLYVLVKLFYTCMYFLCIVIVDSKAHYRARALV